ncbi:hypothetical protein DNTS_020593 [Danionella cerebrum]|uniref:Uncharacterized protein n=1 Tax=Danionella cerebrum TaxID=2873325 RepID=A0A553R546_9TELE|nr:hypothetical protein DNTS_020593 [Danionella translucida]
MANTVVLEDDNAIKMIYPPPHLPISNPYIPPSIIWKMFPWQQSHYPPQVMSCLSLAEQQTVRVALILLLMGDELTLAPQGVDVGWRDVFAFDCRCPAQKSEYDVIDVELAPSGGRKSTVR